MKVFLVALSFFVVCLNVAVAGLQPNQILEGNVTRDGGCIHYRILLYSVIGEGGGEVRKARIFEEPCGSGCMEEIYDGPLDFYGGDYESQILLGGLPITINGSGNGVVTVPLGSGGFLHPSGNPGCDAEFTSDNSSTLIISGQFLSGIVVH